MRVLDWLEILAVFILAACCGVAALLTLILVALYSGILPS